MMRNLSSTGSPGRSRGTSRISNLVALAAACFAGALAQAEVKMPSIFSDNMVLQQGMPVPVWGWAEDGEEITVVCQGQRLSTVAKGGKWMVRLKNLKVAAADTPETLTVEGKNRLRFQNVLVGEVWIASGQSNMEWPLSKAFQAEGDIKQSANPNLRLFTVDKFKSDKPLDDLNTRRDWLPCLPVNSTWFSAVGYYFGRDLQKARSVPVGVIHTSWGGSPAEVWMSQQALQSNPSYLLDILDPAPKAMENYQTQLAAHQKKTADLKKAGQTNADKPPRVPWMPCELYNGMIHPLAPFAVKGAIWYQGESNAGRAWQYRTLFPDMIKNWRSLWGQNEFFFMAVQLAPFIPGGRNKATEPGDSDWAELREAQLLATKLPGVGLAVITDVGEERDIHPTKKAPVGERLALQARGIAYREKSLVYAGPIFKSAKIKKDKVILGFEHTGDGLEARGAQALKGFAICGEDRKWVWAQAEISGKMLDEVIVSHSQVPKPVAVRYGWADYPEGNLWNKNGLPASPFRTDDFPLTTQPKTAAKP